MVDIPRTLNALKNGLLDAPLRERSREGSDDLFAFVGLVKTEASVVIGDEYGLLVSCPIPCKSRANILEHALTYELSR